MDLRYNHSYTSVMKTAISIPDDVFNAAELTAKKMALSRSELYTRAIRSYLEELSDANVTESLNAVYAETPSVLDPALMRAQRRALGQGRW